MRRAVLIKFLQACDVDYRDARNLEELRAMALPFCGGVVEATTADTLKAWHTRVHIEQPADLPNGWQLGKDEEGDLLFINLNEEPVFETYDDPRLIEHPSERPGQVHVRRNSVLTGQMKAGGKAMVIAPLDQDAFKQMPWKLATAKDVPLYGRGHPTPNRYKDILPTAASRYKLKVLGNEPSTEYINANWVKGPPSWNTNYIAAQGPTGATVAAFHRMLWESNAECVVMTTKLRESGKQKCAPYIPRPGGAPAVVPIPGFAGINVATDSVAKTDYGKITNMTLSQGGESRTLKHFHFTEWPDHGVPRDAEGNLETASLLKMMDEVRTFMATEATDPKAPIVVHCSAGIGRTGTYMGMDICTKLLKRDGRVDIVKVVDRMREERGALVQHAAQLSYLHEAVTQWAAAENGKTVATESVTEVDIGGKTYTMPVAGLEMSQKEAAKQGMSYALFQKIDADKSGSITSEEMKDFIAMMVKEERALAKKGSLRKRKDSVRGRKKKPKGPQRGGNFVQERGGAGAGAGGAKGAKGAGGAVGGSGGAFGNDNWDAAAAELGPNPNSKQFEAMIASRLDRMSVMDGELSLGTIEFNGDLFYFYDVDGDGEMSLDEAHLQGMTDDMFHDIDQDGDGKISKDEFRAYQAKLAKPQGWNRK